MALNLTKQQVTNLLKRTLDENFGTTPQRASDEQYYKALSIIAKNILIEKRKKFMAKTHSHGGKQVYYMCMEFLMGRTLKNSLYNLGMQNAVRAALDELGVNLDNIYEQEPDPASPFGFRRARTRRSPLNSTARSRSSGTRTTTTSTMSITTP